MLCKLACCLLTQLICTSIYQHDCLLESLNHNIGSAFTRCLIMPEHMLFYEDALLLGREASMHPLNFGAAKSLQISGGLH